MLALAWVNVIALGVVVVVALAVDGVPRDVRGGDLAWAALYGVALVGALVTAFKSMTIGPVGLVAPIISTEGAFATLLGLALGESVGGVTGGALAVVVVGIVLSAIDSDGRGGGVRVVSGVNRRALLLGLASAVLFAVTLVAGSRADSLGALWTVVVGRVAGTVFVSIPVLTRTQFRRPVGAWRMVGINAAGDLLGFTIFILATKDGVAIPAVLGSQYATLAAVFGYVVFGERLKPWQWIGVAITIAGTALVAASSA